MKENADTVEKYSVKDIEPFILSIIEANPELTEEQICLNLEYNRGYISQLRSREKTTGEPQVSPRFYKQLKNLSLQNAMYGISHVASISAAEPQMEYLKGQAVQGLTSKGQAVFVEAKDLTASYERIIEAKEQTIAEKEARRLEAAEWAKRAESEKKDLFEMLKDYLKEILANSKKSKEAIQNLRTEIIAENGEMMATLDQIAGNKPGTTAAKAGTLELAHRVHKAKKGKNSSSAVGKTGK